MPVVAIGCEFQGYRPEAKAKAFETISAEGGLQCDGLDHVLSDYQFTKKTLMRDDFIGILEKRPSLKQHRSVADRVIEKIREFVETFVERVD